ncbi:hypothetical protein BGZ88_006386 [Linnemannia elongata]|nr:hypothetical protein BGZ88_006386 [Linnemannia elongata]
MSTELQSFRQGLDGPIVQLQAEFDDETGKHLIYWEDVQFAFPGVHCVKSGIIIVAFVRDKQRRRIEPLCIAYEPNVVLEVVMAATPAVAAANALPSPFPSPASSTTVHTRYEDVTPPPSTGSRILSDHSSTASLPLSSSSFRPFQQVEPTGRIEMICDISNENMASVSRPYQHVEPTGRIEEFDGSSNETMGYPFPSGSSDFSIDTVHEVGSYYGKEPSPMSTPTNNGPPPPIPERPYALTRAYAPTRPYAPPPSTEATLATIEAVEISNTSVVTTRHFVQRTESVVQLFGHLVVKGQHEQALLVKRESESIKQYMAQHHESLQSELAKNTALQSQMMEMQAAVEKMTKRILELQEAANDNDKRMMVMQQQALDRLSLIQSKAEAILKQTYELHEYPIPRLFIILPKEDTTRREKLTTLFGKRFRLHFLCECGEHTRPNDGSESKMSHHIHLARHRGYDLDRPNEFFRKYGSYVLALLQMLKYGVAAAGMVVSPLNTFKFCEGLDQIKQSLQYLEKDIVPMVDNAIKYLEGLSSVQDGTTRLPEDGLDNASATTLVEPVIMSKLEALEGADLRHLGSFLKDKDEARVLGDLYRTVTSDGRVKWVCFDHYRETYRASVLKEFRNNVAANNGEYDDRLGRVTIRLTSTLLAQQFYSILSNTRFVQEMFISLAWDTSMDDFRMLKDAIQQSIIYRLDINGCGFSGSNFDIVNRGRRWEPILQMMGNGKLGIITVRNMPGFLLRSGKMPATLQIRVLDMSEQLILMEEFSKLRKLLLAAPNLSELSLLVPSICDGFDLVKQLTGDLKRLSTLSLKRQDGSMATMSYRKGSKEVANTELSICTYETRRILQLPMVTTLSLFGSLSLSRSTAQNVDTILTALRAYRQLKSLEITCAPEDALRILLSVYQNIDNDLPLNLITLRNAERDIIITSRGFPVTDLDFGNYVIPAHAFIALGSVLATCTQLEILAFITPSLKEGIEFVRGVDAMKGSLRNLTVRQPDWSKAEVDCIPGTGEVESIKLRICYIDPREISGLPNVKKVSIFDKRRNTVSALDAKQHDLGVLAHAIISSFPGLTALEILDLDAGAKESLNGFLQSSDDFSRSQEQPSDDQTQAESQEVQVRKAGSCSMVDLPEEFVILGKAFLTVRWILHMPLIISSADISSAKACDSSIPAVLTFAVIRNDGSLASIRIGTDTNDGSPVVLRIGDFTSDDSTAPVSGASLTIMCKGNDFPLDDLIFAATKRCQGLVSLAVVVLNQGMTYPSFLRMLGTVHEAARQRPTLRVFKDWGLERSKNMGVFDIPVTFLETTRHAFANEELPILDELFSSCHHLSEMDILIIDIWESFQAIKNASLLHKRLSKVRLRHQRGLALLLVLFDQSTGEVVATRLEKFGGVELPNLFLLPKVVTLAIEGMEGVKQMEESILRCLHEFREVHTLEIRSPMAQFFQSLITVQKAMLDPRALTKVEIWGFVDHKSKSAFDLPLTGLDLSQRILQPPELSQLVNVLEVSPSVKSLELQVPTVHEHFEVLRQIAKHFRTLSRLTLGCPDGSGAVVEFEETGGNITSLELRLPMDTLVVTQLTDQDSSDMTAHLAALQTRQILALPESILKIFEWAQIATMDSPLLRQIKILNGDRSPITYDIPILRLSSGSWTLSLQEDIPKVDRVIGIFSELTTLDLLVPAIDQAFATIFLLAKGVEKRSKISTVAMRQADGSRVTISFQTVAERTHRTVVTLRLPGATAPTLVNPTPPPAANFSILRMPNETFETLVTALTTARKSQSIHHINIVDSTDALLFSFALAIQSLDLGPVVFTNEETSRLKRILDLTAHSLSRLELFVESLDEHLQFFLPAIETCKQLSSFILKRKDGARASFEIQSGTSSITTVSLQIPGYSNTFATPEQRRKVYGFTIESAIALEGEAIFRLKDLSDSELRFFAAIQQLTARHPGLRQLQIKDSQRDDNNSLVTIATPVQEINLPVSLLPYGAHVLARLLSYCPLLSELAITVDDLETTALSFAKALPEHLKELSKLLLRQTRYGPMVSFHRSAASPGKKRDFFDGGNIMVQVYSLPPTSNLLKLPNVKVLTVMAYSVWSGPQAVSQERVFEITAIVKTAMAHFPDLKSLEIHRSQELFDSLKAALAELLGLESLALPFDLHLIDDLHPNLQPKRITILRNIAVSSSKQKQEQYRQQTQQQTTRTPRIFDIRKLPADQKNVDSVCSMIKRSQYVIRGKALPLPTHFIFRDWNLNIADWARLLSHIDYLAARYLDFFGSNFGDTQLQMLVNSIIRIKNKLLTPNSQYSVWNSTRFPQELADLAAQEESARRENDDGGGAGDFDVGPMMVYLGGSQVTPLKALLEQEQLRSAAITWCRLTMDDGYQNE